MTTNNKQIQDLIAALDVMQGDCGLSDLKSEYQQPVLTAAANSREAIKAMYAENEALREALESIRRDTSELKIAYQAEQALEKGGKDE